MTDSDHICWPPPETPRRGSKTHWHCGCGQNWQCRDGAWHMVAAESRESGGTSTGNFS